MDVKRVWEWMVYVLLWVLIVELSMIVRMLHEIVKHLRGSAAWA